MMAGTAALDTSMLPRPELDTHSVLHRVALGDPVPVAAAFGAPDANAYGGAYGAAVLPGIPPGLQARVNLCTYDPSWCCPWELLRPCEPHFMSMTVCAFPASAAVRAKYGLPLAAVVRPLAPPPPPSLLGNQTHEAVPVVNFGAAGVVRCRRCRTYINFAVIITDGGRRWRCNVCQLLNDIPPEYYAPLDANGRRIDIQQRPELCCGSVEFVAPSEYMVRPPQPPVYVFVLDVSYAAVASGTLATAVESVRDCLDVLPRDGRTRVGLLTFSTQVTYYALPAGETGEPRIVVVPDVDDVFLPSPEDVLVNLEDARPAVDRLLGKLLQLHPPTSSSFAPSAVEAAAQGGALGSAIAGAFYLMQHWGGKMVVVAASRPTIGMGKLRDRDDVHAFFTERECRLLLPEDGQYKRRAVDFTRAQVSVDLYLTPPAGAYVDVASLSSLAKYTGGEFLHLPGFDASRDGPRLRRALARNLSRETGFEAVFRLRASNGVRCARFHGRFFTRSTDLLALPNVDADKTYVVELGYEESQVLGKHLCAQSALLYTTSGGERRIRVHTVVLPITSSPHDLFRSADVNATVNALAHQLIEHCVHRKPESARRAVVDRVVDMLVKYRQLLGSAAASSTQLLLPDALRCLPLYTLGMVRSAVLSRDAAMVAAMRTDCKAALLQALDNGSVSTLMAFAYPNCVRLEDGQGVRASMGALQGQGLVLIDNGFEVVVWVARDVAPSLLTALVSDDVARVMLAQPAPTHPPPPKLLGEALLSLPLEPESDRGVRMRRLVHAVLAARTDAAPSVSIVRQDTPAEARVHAMMVEDHGASELGYAEFLATVQRQVQQRLMGGSSTAGR